MDSVANIDVLVVGGGPAGLSAALYLGRARREVWVVDAGEPRHAVAEGVHNLLTRDGLPPAELRRIAWNQMEAYPTVQHRPGRVLELSLVPEAPEVRWRAKLADGGEVEARAVLLAMGVLDRHPDIPGYAARWGHSIHHCPFCHGWELRDRPLALLAEGEVAAHMGPLLTAWSSDVVVLSHGRPMEAEVRDQLASFKVPVFDSPVVELAGPGRELSAIHLQDGTVLGRRGLFVQADQQQVPLVHQLGVELDETGYVRTDAMGKTSLPMMWAAGDLSLGRGQQVVLAAARGGMAGGAIHGALVFA